MKTTVLLLFSLFIFSLKVDAQFVSPNSNIIDIPSSEQKAQAGKWRSVLSGVSDNYDLKYHRCEWSIDPAVNYIRGAVTSYFKPILNGFDQIEFDLSDSLTVDSVKYHNSVLSFSRLIADVIHISLPAAIPINSLDSITVYYQGVPPSTGLGSFIQSTHNGTPVIWTLSEPFGAKEWWPCKQSLNDKIDSVDIIVITPQINRVASNGILLSENTSAGDKIYHWKTRYPIAAYLIAIAVTNYSSYSDYVPLPGGDSLQVLNYVYPENDSLARTQTTGIINIIKFFDSLTITYPFVNEKYGHAQFGWGGGMEHQTMSFVVDFNHALMAHECAHQWFGDHITCGSWQDIWLNEGFATYFEGLTEERFFPDSWMQWKASAIASITSSPGGTVLCDDTTSVGRIFDGRLSYKKGAYLLHMLRWKLGDSLFFLSIKNYLNDPLLAGKYARTPDLIAHFEAAGNQSLTEFFNQWYYNQGFPSYHLLWGQTLNEVTLTVNQTQSDPSVSFFEMPVPVKFIGQNADTTIVFDHTNSGQIFNVTVPFPIVSVQFDPMLWLLSAGNTISGISEYPLIGDQVIVYPNPAKDNINILSLNNANTVESIEITDVLGRIVFRSEIYNGIQKLVTINTGQYAKGTYFIKTVLKSGVNYKSFIKE